MIAMIRLAVFVAVIGFVASQEAIAKDICVVDDAGVHWRFSNVKSLKAGASVALNGVYAIGVANCPAAGTAVVTQAGAVIVGVTVHCAAPIAANNFTRQMIGTPDFTATGQDDNDWDGVADAGTKTWTPEDCKTAARP